MSCTPSSTALAGELGSNNIAKYAPLGLAQKTGMTCPTRWPASSLHPMGDENYHQRYYPATLSPSASARVKPRSRQSNLGAALADRRRHGHFVPVTHVVNAGSGSRKYAPIHSSTASPAPRGQNRVPLNQDTWMTITDGNRRCHLARLYHTGLPRILRASTFRPKTRNRAGSRRAATPTPRAAPKPPTPWFVGMIPRRNPELDRVLQGRRLGPVGP